MGDFEYIVRYFNIDDDGTYRRGTAITRSPHAYIQKHECDDTFMLVSIEPIDRTYTLSLELKKIGINNG